MDRTPDIPRVAHCQCFLVVLRETLSSKASRMEVVWLANWPVHGVAQGPVSCVPFKETVPRVRYTCVTVISSGISLSSRNACGRPLDADDPRVAESQMMRAKASSLMRRCSAGRSGLRGSAQARQQLSLS